MLVPMMILPRGRWGAIFFLCAWLAPGTAAAEHELPKPVWEAGLALGWASYEAYPGSANRRAITVGAPWFIYRGKYLRSSGQSARVVFRETEKSWLDLSGGGWVPVDSSRESRRQGMPDLDMVFQLGPRAGRMLSRGEHHEALIRLSARAAWSISSWDDQSHRGYVIDPQARFTWRPRGHDGGLQFSTTLSGRWADRQLSNYYYGVSPEYATPDRPEWDAPPGLQSAELEVSFGWRFHPRWTVGGFVAWRDLGWGSVRDSPLMETTTSLMLGLGINWTYAASERMVSDRRIRGDEPL